MPSAVIKQPQKRRKKQPNAENLLLTSLYAWHIENGIYIRPPRSHQKDLIVGFTSILIAQYRINVYTWLEPGVTACRSLDGVNPQAKYLKKSTHTTVIEFTL